MQRDRVAGFFGEPLIKNPDSLVDIPDHAVRQRQQPPGFAVLRPECDHLAEAFGGFPGSLQPVQQDAEIGEGVDVPGIDANGGAIGRFRFERLAARSQHHAAVTVRIGMTGVDGDRLLIGLERRPQLARRLKNDAEVVVTIGATRCRCKALLDERDGSVAVPFLVRQHARIVQRVGMIRRGVEDTPVQLPGFDQLPIFLQQDGERHCLVER